VREQQQDGASAPNREPRDRAAPAGTAAGQAIVTNLMQAITQLHNDLDRVELWTATLDCFLRPVPDYQPSDKHMLPSASTSDRQDRRR
jgi:hypothetical protein